MNAIAYVLSPPVTTQGVVEEALQHMGFQQRVFTDGKALIDALYHGQPSLVCLDVAELSDDPYELVRRIRPRAPLVPMMILTAPEDDLSKETFLKMGADDCSIRTVNPAVLAKRTRSLMARTQATYSDANNSGTYAVGLDDARTLAHELKNELHPLRMLVSMLEDPTHPHRELVPLMRQAVERMCVQVEDMLDGTPGARGDTASDLFTVCSNCCAMFQSAYRHRPDLEIKFSSSFSAGDAILNVRPGVLHQVLSNLVGNAIDALSSSDRETSRVWLQADTDWSVAMIRIGDNGPGVSPEIRAQMFERDFTTKGEGGSGIGLSVVRQIISKLGGNVDVVSDPGRGTVVTVALPLR